MKDKNIIIKSFIETFEEIYGEIKNKNDFRKFLKENFFRENKIIHPELNFILELKEILEEGFFDE